MRFLLYNIRYATGKAQSSLPWRGYMSRTSEHMESIIDYIDEVDPDITGLVEVDGGSFRASGLNQSLAVARRIQGCHSYRSKYCESTKVASLPVLNKQGNAFITKTPANDERFHYLSRGVKRLVIDLEYDGVRFLLVHLALGYRARHAQLREIHQLIKDTDSPVVVAGDFNVLSGPQELELFLEATGLENANLRGAPTFPSWRPKSQLDFVLHSQDLTVSDFIVPQVPFSDHLPLVVDFSVD
ncbi:MAG: endonuclease/exonuclease/phosphatase family protein [Verrucomicrobiota bacterium]